MTLVVICIVLFAVAAVFGIISFVRRMTTGGATGAIGYIHGAIATLSLVLLVVYSVIHSAAAPNWAFRLFVIAALAGFVFFGIKIVTNKPPKLLGLVHGALALAVFVFLLVFAFAGGWKPAVGHGS
jgi:hypothetical protein